MSIELGHATDRKPPFKYAAFTRVGFSDTDAQGIVYYGRYLPYFDQARVEYHRHLDLLGEAMRGLARQFDSEWGGFGRAPKFPPASTLEFLLRRHRANDEEALAMVTRTLDGMAAGGMYDLLGGGFHRYSVDEQWLVPHFEKMLYDNALLVPVYLHAWLVTGEKRYRAVANATLDYLVRELRLPEGGSPPPRMRTPTGSRG